MAQFHLLRTAVDRHVSGEDDPGCALLSAVVIKTPVPKRIAAVAEAIALSTLGISPRDLRFGTTVKHVQKKN